MDYIFQPSAFSNWSIIVQFGLLALMLLIGNMIRRRVKFLKNLLFPAAIIAGFLGLGLRYILAIQSGGTYIFSLDGGNNPLLTLNFLDNVTYHALAIGFVALGLKTVKMANNKLKGRPAKTGMIIVNTYLLQGVIGVVITIIFALVFVNVVEPFGGLLLAMGLGQGPAQAGNIGGVFQTDGSFNGARAFGLAIAAIGFLWACVGGIIFLNNRGKEGKVLRVKTNTAGEAKPTFNEDANEIPLSDAIDKFTMQGILVAVVYLVAYLFVLGLTQLIYQISPGVHDTVAGLIWGFNFIFAMLFAILFKLLLNLMLKKKIITRKYTNEYMLDRIAGFVFDFMIAASLMAIDVEVFINYWQLLITLLVITTAGGFATFFYLRFMIKRIYPDYEVEAFACLFGNLTGKASTGIALLREIDPQFSTPAADDLVTGSGMAIAFGAPLLLITALIWQGNRWGWQLWTSLAIMIAGFVLYQYLLLRKPRKKIDAPATEQPDVTIEAVNENSGS